MIKDTTLFVQILKKQGHEIILTIDINELFISGEGGIAKLITDTKVIDPFSSHNIYTNINTHQRGSNQLFFIFTTPIINTYILKFLWHCHI